MSSSEGIYEGTVHSIDTEKRKLTLTKGLKVFQFVCTHMLLVGFSSRTRLLRKFVMVITLVGICRKCMIVQFLLFLTRTHHTLLEEP